jgi:hypothetical protein
MAKKPGLKAVSTALATMAIILVLILGMSWMAYMVVLNARQQAEMAGRAETVALKAKELIRVYVWLDPARQPDGRHLNLTRISFVGEWSGETVINGLLIAYTDGRTEVRNVNIRLRAGEDRTYLPSELGLTGLDNYNTFRVRVKYIQAHTSLGNDFVNVWGRPDKPALYVTGTTRTDTYTTTRTETSRIPTTTTTSVTRTSYTTTVTTTRTTTWTPPPGVPYGIVWCTTNYYGGFTAYVEFNANGWGTPPYQIRVYATYYDWMWNVIRTDEVAVFTVSGTSYSTSFGLSHPYGYGGIAMSMRAVDVNGLYAEWGGGGCYSAPPPPPGTTSSTSLTTSTGPPTTTTGNTIVTVTETITSTTFTTVYSGQGGVNVITATSTFIGTTTVTQTRSSWVTTTVTFRLTAVEQWYWDHWCQNLCNNGASAINSPCIKTNTITVVNNVSTIDKNSGKLNMGSWFASAALTLMIFESAEIVGIRRRFKEIVAVILLVALCFIPLMNIAPINYVSAQTELTTTTVTSTQWVTSTATMTVTSQTTVTSTTTSYVIVTITITETYTSTMYTNTYVATVRSTQARCDTRCYGDITWGNPCTCLWCPSCPGGDENRPPW